MRRVLALSLAALAAKAAGLPPEPSRQCAACHPAQSRAHWKTLMALTMASPTEAPLLRANPDLSWKSGPYSYRIFREGDRPVYSVTDGRNTISSPILWALGEGKTGQTYIVEHEGRLYESRASYYGEIKGLDVTIGPEFADPDSLLKAFGRFMTTGDVVACLNCHSVKQPGGPAALRSGSAEWAQARVPGVHCEHCHLSPAHHASARMSGDRNTARMPRLKDLVADETSELCGKCHRTWADIDTNGPKGIANVRFQPYRIALSKCYDPGDVRISCTACHDPHDRSKEQAPAYFDKVCESCHRAGAKTVSGRRLRLCKTAKADCVSCHMPKYEIPGSHWKFADHFIRVVRPGEPYPG